MIRARPGVALCRLAGILLLCLAWLPAQAQTDPWETATKAGVEAFGKGELAAAERHFRKALELAESFAENDPRRSVGNSNMGVKGVLP